MSRIPMNENLSRQYNQETEGWQKNSWKQVQDNMSTLRRGGNVVANPFEQADYLANQNRLQASALNANENSGKEQLQDVERRSGGLNSGATRSAIEGLGLGKMRMADELTAQRRAQDYKNNISYQQWATGIPLQTFQTATGGRNSAQNQLTQYGLQQQKEWYDLLGQGIQAGKAAASAGVSAGTGGAGVGGFGEG